MRRTLRSVPAGKPALAVALLGAATLLSGVFVDRAVATYVHQAAYSTPVCGWAMEVFPVLIGAGGCLLLMFLGIGAAALARRPLRPWMTGVLALGGAGLIGLVVAELLKFVLGRSQVYPTYLVDGVYRFAPVHEGPGYGAFPSATETAAGAVLVVLWVWPRGRLAYGLVLLIISVALIVTNSHWVSDLLGGALIGGSIGWAVVRRP